MTNRAWALGLVVLVGCTPAREDPTSAMLVSGAMGTYEGLNRATNCMCSLDPVDTNHRRFALSLNCHNGAEPVLDQSWLVLMPVRNQRLLLPADVADFGRSVMIATLARAASTPAARPSTITSSSRSTSTTCETATSTPASTRPTSSPGSSSPRRPCRHPRRTARRPVLVRRRAGHEEHRRVPELRCGPLTPSCWRPRCRPVRAASGHRRPRPRCLTSPAWARAWARCCPRD